MGEEGARFISSLFITVAVATGGAAVAAFACRGACRGATSLSRRRPRMRMPVHCFGQLCEVELCLLNRQSNLVVHVLCGEEVARLGRARWPGSTSSTPRCSVRTWVQPRILLAQQRRICAHTLGGVDCPFDNFSVPEC